ncbi:hypothetical protein BJ170DRAFT_386867 [Xylariales sp. AK1849]|nr:hypothetical protein BJ170DRAFT_386867 [Xylariales sp. AK1849]
MKVLQITVGFLPVLSLAAVLARDTVSPAICVGIAYKEIEGAGGGGELEYNGWGEVGTDGSNPEYDASSLDTYQAADLCGATVNGQVVTCNGDVTQTCSAYGVATYNGLNCRTICTSSGDPSPCWLSSSGSANAGISGVIICDQTL